MNLKEKIIDTITHFQGKIIKVTSHTVISCDNDQQMYREKVEHPGGVFVAYQNSDTTFSMVNQFRFGIDEESLEFVAGKKEKNEDPLITAQRELEEEIGIKNATLIPLGFIYPSPAYLNEKIHLFYGVGGDHTDQKWDEDERLELHNFSLEEILNKIQSNEIHNASTICLAYRVKEFLEGFDHEYTQPSIFKR